MSGFSLVEVLVCIMIFAFLTSGVYAISNIGNSMYHIELGFLDLQQSVRQAIYQMERELRESSSQNMSIVTLDTNNDQVTFNTPNEANIKYYCDLSDVNSDNIQTQIIREHPSGNYKILGNDISSLQFSLVGQLLEIHLIANKSALGRNLLFPLRTKVRLRNE